MAESTSMKRPIINYVTLTNGWCGLTTDSKREAYNRLGSENIASFGPASQRQLDWVQAMGGKVPHGRVSRSTESIE